jgi:hypothetical protein
MRTITIYSLRELKDVSPEGYAKVLKRWRETCCDDFIPWDRDTIQSYKALVEACGGRFKDYNIGPWDNSWAKVVIDNEVEETEGWITKNADWFLKYVLEPKGIKLDPATGKLIQGGGEFTGYCGDNRFVNEIYEDLSSGYDIQEALENMARVAQKMMEDDSEQFQEEDNMLANWEQREYTIDGVWINA